MNNIGCDFHTRFQQIASRNPESGAIEQRHLEHTGDTVRQYYASLVKPVRVGIESTGYSLWFDQLLQELGIELVVGDAAAIAARRVKKQKNDKADAELILQLLQREEFPVIYWPNATVRDQRALLRHRHRLVRMRTRVKNSLQALALSNRLALKAKLFTTAGLKQLNGLALPAYMAVQRCDSLTLLQEFNQRIEALDEEILKVLEDYPAAQRLLTHPGVGPITALATVLILGPVERFKEGKRVASYLGLVPAERSSGGHQQFGSITKQGSRLLRFLLLEAGLSASRKDAELKRLYYRLAAKKGHAKAKVAVARKLSIRLYIMLREGVDYAEFWRRGPRRP